MDALIPDKDSPAPRAVRRASILVFGILSAIFALTAQWRLPYHIDALTNAITGWQIGNEHTVVLDRHDALAEEDAFGVVVWFVTSPRGTVSQYPPGAALLAGLVYSVAPGDLVETELYASNEIDAGPWVVPLPPLWPATLSAVLLTAGACGLLTSVFIRLGSNVRRGAVAGLVAGLATGAWSVASSASWMHGPAMFFLAAALAAAQRERWVVTGSALACAILIRPHLALIVVAIGPGLLLRKRDVRAFVEVAVASASGLIALVVYNWWLFGRLTISGGYGAGFERQFASASPSWFARNVLGGLLDPSHGLLTWSPFVAVLAIGALATRGRPTWVSGAAVGGVLYLLVQWRANRFSGGDGHYGYRYPLETLTVAAPALYLGYERWVREKRMPERLLRLGIAAAVALQAAAAMR